MTIEERFESATDKIVAMIDMYGKEKFAHSLIRYYGLRSLLDKGDLDWIFNDISNN